MADGDYNSTLGLAKAMERPSRPILDFMAGARGLQAGRDMAWLNERRRLQGLRQQDWEYDRANRQSARDALTPYLNEAQRITANGGDVGAYFENLKKNIGSDPKFVGMNDQAQAMFHQGLNNVLTSKLQAAVKAGKVDEAERYSRMTGTPVNLAPVYAGYGDVHNTIRVLKQANPNWDIRASDDGNTVYINGQAHDTGRWLNAIANNNYAAEQAAASQRAEATERQLQLQKALFPESQGEATVNVENPNPNAGANAGAANGAAPPAATAPAATPTARRAFDSNPTLNPTEQQGNGIYTANVLGAQYGNYGDEQYNNLSNAQQPFMNSAAAAAGLDMEAYQAQRQLAEYAEDPNEALNFRQLTGIDLPEVISNPKGYQQGNNMYAMALLRAYNRLKQFPNSYEGQYALRQAVKDYVDFNNTVNARGLNK